MPAPDANLKDLESVEKYLEIRFGGSKSLKVGNTKTE